MRFAGSAVENYLGTGPDLGALSQKSAINDAKMNITGLQTESMLNATGIGEYGETLGTQAVLEAQADYGAAQQQASNMAQIGQLAGNALGSFGSFGGGGGGAAGGATSWGDIGGLDLGSRFSSPY